MISLTRDMRIRNFQKNPQTFLITTKSRVMVYYLIKASEEANLLMKVNITMIIPIIILIITQI